MFSLKIFKPVTCVKNYNELFCVSLRLLNLCVHRAVIQVSGNVQKKEGLPAVFLVCFVQRGIFQMRQVEK